MLKSVLSLLFLLITLSVAAQKFQFEKVELSDPVNLALKMQNLAKDYLQQAQGGNLKVEPHNRYFIEILAGNYEAAIDTIQSTRKNVDAVNNHPKYIAYEIFAKAKIKQSEQHISFEKAYRLAFRNYLTNCSDEQAYSVNIIFTTYDNVRQFTNWFKRSYEHISEPSLNEEEALNLLKSYFLYHVYTVTEPIVFQEIKRDQNVRYIIEEKLIVSSIDSAEITVTIARKRDLLPLPAILTFTIYADSSTINQALIPASKGYVGVLATSRGKRLSNNPIKPYIHEHKDVYATIDWISKQSWNNGRVGMFGGSYNGFSQWASMKKKVHPALKTIVPSVSAAPGIDVPMENNIFHNFAYKWIPFVTENKFLGHSDPERWSNLQNNWYSSGASYNKMDSIDQTPSPIFQEWISHPSYDAYWQNMIPYQDEFAHIDIPILSTTGYYDDGQPGAMYYYSEHVKYRPSAEHYLLIGPYDHWGAQSTPSTNLRGYQIDETARIDIQGQLIFDWFDYILKGKEKPSILKNKVNFQVMGANKWAHGESLSKMNNGRLSFYLSTNRIDDHYSLIAKKAKVSDKLKLDVDFADRSMMNNPDYYPWPIIKDSINLNDGLVFMTEPLQEEHVISGSFAGELIIESNKKDFDFSVNLYELTPEGKYFHLSYYIGRASYNKSNEDRALLKPNQATTIAFDNTRIVCKKISKDSRVVVIINGNKNAYAQVNYGTGRDVSNESILDASQPLKLLINTQSKITLPIWVDE